MTSTTFAPSPFTFKPDEKVDHGFLRVLGQMANRTRSLTRHSHGILSEAVHEIRILIKQLRALLWFASPIFSPMEVNRGKAHLRKASQLLAAQRDQSVMRSVLEELSHQTSNSTYRKTLFRIAHAQDSRQDITVKSGQSLQQAAAILLMTIQQLKEQAKSHSRWPSVADRLDRAFLATKKAGGKALHAKDPARFHDWRKKAKRLFYQLQLTQAVPGKRMRHTISRVDKLQEMLGDYHDSVIVEDRLRKHLADKITPLLLRKTVNLLKKRKNRLRKKVRKIAKCIKLYRRHQDAF